jgi:hypothetical protein
MVGSESVLSRAKGLGRSRPRGKNCKGPPAEGLAVLADWPTRENNGSSGCRATGMPNQRVCQHRARWSRSAPSSDAPCHLVLFTVGFNQSRPSREDWIFIYGTASGAWNSVAAGAVIFIIGLTRVASLVGPLLARVNVVLGLWTIASPWVFGYSAEAPAMWNSIAVGIAVTLLALWSANATVSRNRQENRLAVGP